MYPKLIKRFESAANPEKAQQMSQYMRNQFEFYGIQAAERKVITKDLVKAFGQADTIDWPLLNKCWQHPKREAQYFVIDALKRSKKKLNFYDIHNLWQFIKSKQWWDTIDALDTIVGDIGLIDPRINDLMIGWAQDDDFWVRRLAINHQRLRKDKTNVALLAKIIEMNFGSNEFFINKAIGWSLREYSKVDPQWVRNFIHKHEQAMDVLSMKEASKYIYG